MKKIIGRLFVLLIVGIVFLLPLPAYAMTGSGTIGDPYMIYTVTDLQNMNLDLDAYYELANDIDASATSGWNAGAGFIPIGFFGTPFSGTFDGKGYTISTLTIVRPTADNVGLFGSTSGANITNVSLSSAAITGDDDVGVLIGNSASTTVSQCYITGGTLVGDVDVGGLIGYDSSGTLSTCYTTCAVTGVDYVGGLLGIGTQSDVDACYATGNIIGTSYVGGIAGYAYQANLATSYSTGSVTQSGAAGEVGGFIGYARSSTITGCCSTGNVSGVSDLGGFIGYFKSNTVSQCYATGNVTATAAGSVAGGFIGRTTTSGTTTNCYANGMVDCDNIADWDVVGGFIGYLVAGASVINCYSIGAPTGDDSVGGFCGYNSGTITSCYWDTQTSGVITSDGGTGLTTAQLKAGNILVAAGWDFTNIWGVDYHINDGYPYLRWSVFSYDWGDFEQVSWFQPIDIISGTTLPDRSGTRNGIIFWGTNPGGITLTLGPLSENQTPASTPTDTAPGDMVGPTGQPGWTGGLPTLPSNPFYPIINTMATLTAIPVGIMWIMFATLLLLLAMAFTYKYMPHLLMVCFVGGGLSAFWVHIGIYPFWVIFIFVVGAIACLVSERSPTIG